MYEPINPTPTLYLLRDPPSPSILRAPELPRLKDLLDQHLLQNSPNLVQLLGYYLQHPDDRFL